MHSGFDDVEVLIEVHSDLTGFKSRASRRVIFASLVDDVSHSFVVLGSYPGYVVHIGKFLMFFRRVLPYHVISVSANLLLVKEHVLHHG